MKEKILDAAELLVQSRGLNAVTFQDIADAVNLRKPSLFHHVKNKEELVLLLIERCCSKHGPSYAAIVSQDSPAPQKLIEIAKLFEMGLKESRPCLLAAIGSARESLSKEASKQLQAAAEQAVSRIASVFSQGRKEGTLIFQGKPKHAAIGFFGMLQGLQTLCKVNDDLPAFSHASSVYIRSLTAQQ